MTGKPNLLAAVGQPLTPEEEAAALSSGKDAARDAARR